MNTKLKKPVDWQRATRFIIFSLVCVLSITFLSVVYFPVLLPVFLSLFLTYLLAPLVERLVNMTMPRALAVALIIFFVVALFSFGVIKLAPVLYTQVQHLLQLVPNTTAKFYAEWLPPIANYLVEIGFAGSVEDINNNLKSINIVNELRGTIQDGFKGVWATGVTLLGGALNVALVPIITFFLLLELRPIKKGLRRLIPFDLMTPVDAVIDKINITMRSVIKGQVTVALILAILYVIGLSIVGINSAIAIGVVAGICRIIPYLDVVVGLSLSAIVFLADFPGWGQVLGVGLVFLIVQSVDGMFITPRIIGERVGLHPIFVIVSIIAFSNWYGFWGVLLAIPIVAILKVLWQSAIPFYFASKAYMPMQYKRRQQPKEKPISRRQVLRTNLPRRFTQTGKN